MENSLISLIRMSCVLLIFAGLINTSTAFAQVSKTHPAVFLIFFDWQQDTISPDAMTIIQQAADTWRSRKAEKVQIIGYTDRSLAVDESQRSSERMANNVANELIRRGIQKDKLIVSGRGENDNRVPTMAGVQEPQNRRVEVVMP